MKNLSFFGLQMNRTKYSTLYEKFIGNKIRIQNFCLLFVWLLFSLRKEKDSNAIYDLNEEGNGGVVLLHQEVHVILGLELCNQSTTLGTLS